MKTKKFTKLARELSEFEFFNENIEVPTEIEEDISRSEQRHKNFPGEPTNPRRQEKEGTFGKSQTIESRKQDGFSDILSVLDSKLKATLRSIWGALTTWFSTRWKIGNDSNGIPAGTISHNPTL